MDSVDIIVGDIQEKQRRSTGRIVLAIDGAGGAGKSTVARLIRERLIQVSIVAMDDFYRPLNPDVRLQMSSEQRYQNFFDWQRLRMQVLEDIHQKKSIRFQQYDWAGNDLHDWTEMELCPVVVVEGIYVLRPELRPYYESSVVIKASQDSCVARLRSRGNSDEEIRMWQEAEAWYFSHIKPHEYCDFIIPGE
ncbi:MAG: AAA family ATPase [bacterium]